MSTMETLNVLKQISLILKKGGNPQDEVPNCVEALDKVVDVMTEVAVGGLMKRGDVFRTVRQDFLLSDYEKEQLSSALHRIPSYMG